MTRTVLPIAMADAANSNFGQQRLVPLLLVGSPISFAHTPPAQKYTSNSNFAKPKLTEELPEVPPHGAQIDRPVLEVEHGLGVSRRSLLLAVGAIVVGVGTGRQVLVRVVDPVLVEVHLWYVVAGTARG